MRNLSLDGLRGIAIIAVILHHGSLFRGGWAGVDVFFVLSGFLITGILRRDRDSPGYWKRFYVKRASRILPPLLLLIAAVTIKTHPPARSVLAYVFFMGNFASFTRFGIYDLGILWSLAVEEHFYLFFPFAVRYLSRRHLLQLLLAVIVVEPLVRYAATSHFSWYVPIYFWTCFRLDGLAFGAILAVFLEDANLAKVVKRAAAPVGILAGSVFIALSCWMPARFDREANSHLFNAVGYSLIGLMSACLVAHIVLFREGVVSRVLAWRPLVFIGAISYCLYLCHVEIIMKVTTLGLRPAFPIGVAIAVLVSWVSFRFYEGPWIALGHRQAQRIERSADPALTSLS